MTGTLTITWTIREPGAGPGVDVQPDNPLARACRNLLEQGQMLRPVRAETVASGHVPSEDARNRLETFRAAREDAPLQIVEMNGLSPWRETLHFGVAVGHRSAPPYGGPALALPEGSPFLRRRAFCGPMALPVRMHSFPLSPRRQIHVISTWLPVALTLGVTFTGTPTA